VPEVPGMLTACVPRCVPRVSVRLKPPRPRLGGIHARKSRPVVSAAVVQASSRSGSSSRTSWHPPPFCVSSRISAGLRGVAFSRRGVRPSSVRGVSRSRSLSANLNSSRVQPSARPGLTSVGARRGRRAAAFLRLPARASLARLEWRPRLLGRLRTRRRLRRAAAKDPTASGHDEDARRSVG
jgi:hypothetical protein